MYKVIVSNFSNTLINSDEEIPISTIILLDELRRKFIVTTNKDLTNILYYNRDFPFIDYIVSSNGAYVYDAVKNKCIYKKNIGIRIINKIIKEYYKKTDIFITNDNNILKVDDLDILEDNKNNIYKIDLCFRNKKDLDKTLKEINLLNLNININITSKDNKYYIEITNKLVSKYMAVEFIINKLKLKMADVISFGYDLSDIELLKKSKCGVAVENASKKVKSVADKITLDNNSKGVEIYLKNVM